MFKQMWQSSVFLTFCQINVKTFVKPTFEHNLVNVVFLQYIISATIALSKSFSFGK